MDFSSEEIKSLRVSLKDCEALKAIAEKYGCEVKIDKIKYSEIDANVSIIFVKKGVDGVSAEQNEFIKYAPMFGFKPEHYGFTFTASNGKEYTLFGFNLKARKNYCKLHGADGKDYSCSVPVVMSYLDLIN